MGHNRQVMPVPLADLLRTHEVASGYVEKAIFATDDADAIAGLITETARRQLGVPVTEGLFYAASSGCVFGLRLADGQSIVLKAYQSHWEPPFLRAAQRVQRAVALTGFPCPTPVGDPLALGSGWATFESLLPDPGAAPLDASLMDQSSAALVRLIHATRGLARDGLELHPFRKPADQLYPTPHNPIFDLAGSTTGAEWIDEWARRSSPQPTSESLPSVIAHLDWSARNVRLTPAGLIAVYDWDSIGVGSEAMVAGHAATSWRTTGETPLAASPGAGDVDRFIASVARARGTDFSALEWDVARAAAVSVMAYSARCEHALEHCTPWRRTRSRDWLRTQAGLLLP
jgi:Phosphotransferase enzyme family